MLHKGIAQAQSKQLGQAVTTFNNVLLLSPKNVLALYNLGVIDQMENKTSQASAYYDRAITADSTYTPAMYNKAIILEATDLNGALALYKQIVAINPKASTAYLRMAFVYAKQGQATQAEAARSKAIALDPSLAKYPLPGCMRGSELLTVFTPSHHPVFLTECFQSLQDQAYEDWEWVVLLNKGARWQPPGPDPRVRIIVDDEVDGVGAAKRRACAEARGEILVELDHDDLLAPRASQAVYEAFCDHPELALVYSHTAQILEDGSRDDSMFDLSAGWEYREAVVNGRNVQYAVSLQATPHNVSYIWFAPNHLRAFSREAYDRSGGYDIERRVLDDQDLMCRLYQVGEFRLIDECLYLQRMHSANTQRDEETNAFIQTETIALYDHYIEANALAWAQRDGLLALDLGAAHGTPPDTSASTGSQRRCRHRR